MPGRANLPFSAAVRVGPMLYLSGQLGTDSPAGRSRVELAWLAVAGAAWGARRFLAWRGQPNLRRRPAPVRPSRRLAARLP